MSYLPFNELATATYCPRQLYYQRRDGIDVPDTVARRRELAFQYERLASTSDSELASLPIAIPPDQFRANLNDSRSQYSAVWPELVDPTARSVCVVGRECRGVVHKLLSLETPVPSIVAAGNPPDDGVWQPQTVRAVAAAKAVAWTYEKPIERAFVEYPACGVVRTVELTTRRKAKYRQAVRMVRALDGPPPRLQNDSKCEPCDYRSQCGVKTQSLRSRLADSLGG